MGYTLIINYVEDLW